MSISVIPIEKQEKGSFNLGSIKENRPVILSEKGRSFKPYSNIFYWAHAWSETGSLLGEHPHDSFEILSFVLKGEIEHFDTKTKDWLKLEEGSVQIIRAGNGISHAEDFSPGSEIFQIWLNPDLTKSSNKPATYNDYSPDMFPEIYEDGKRIRIYKGMDNNPIQMETPGVRIKEISFPPGEHIFNLHQEDVLSAYLLEGSIEINNNEMEKDSFAIIKEEEDIRILVETESRLFTIESPLIPSYKTYVDEFPVQV